MAWLTSWATSEQLIAAYDHVSPDDRWRIEAALHL
jgi:hypothetical protein